MISISNISQTYRGKTIFNSLNWSIKKNRKYGLVGPNGTGKTTLLNVVSGILKPDKGEINIPGKLDIGYLAQDLNYKLKDKTVVLEALEGLEFESDELIAENLKYKAEKILMGLGFSVEMFNELASNLSGGWKMRIELAKILLGEPNLLLLDEPTNHLDIESIEWLENYLNNFSGTVVIVSHDKYLIDRMVDTIVELDNGSVTEFKGNYSQYLKEKETIREIQISTFKNQQKKIQQTERFIERFRYKNTKARQVQSRIKMLEKMEVVEEPDSLSKKIKLKFPESPRSGKIVYEISKFSKHYKSNNDTINTVFENSGPLKIERGDRIALAGKNGEGKSTLSKIIVGIEDYIGEDSLGHNVEFSYYAQNQTETLNLENNLYDEFKTSSPMMNETQARSILGSFLFKEEDLGKKVKVLSGGEKSRLALSKMLVAPTNFLILDEPTNHLDIQSKEVLLDALKNYSGTFLIISHDRYFIDQLVNKVWYVENKNIHTHLGNYSEFIDKYKSLLTNTTENNYFNKNNKKGTNKNKKIEAEQRNQLYRELKEKGIEHMQNWKDLTRNQLNNALIDLEQRIVESERNKDELERQMGNPEIFKEKDKLKKNTNELKIISDNLKVMYERWNELGEYLN